MLICPGVVKSEWCMYFLYPYFSPIFQGVVRIHLLEADKLAAKDNYVKGVMSGMSDPYALIRVGPQTFRSRHKDNTDSPKWGEIYEVRPKCDPTSFNGALYRILRISFSRNDI